MVSKQHVLVLGAGIIGTTTAYYLARRGFEVTVIEREAGVGLVTSFANGGLLVPSMADPWAAPGLVRKLLGWVGRKDSPFLVRPAAVPGLISWGARFLINCRAAAWRRNTATILRLAEYSHRALDELTRETGLDYDLAARGTLRLFRDPLSMAEARRNAALVGELGVTYRVLDAAGCAELEPALAPRKDLISGGVHFPDDRSGDAHIFARGLAGLSQEMGVRFRFGVTVQSLETKDGAVASVTTDAGPFEADHYVLALGNGVAGLQRGLGWRLPIYPVKGYSVTFSTQGWNRAPRIPLLDDGRKIGIVPLGNRLRVAGTAEFTGHDLALNARRGAKLVDNLLELFPGLPDPEAGQHWTGLRPTTPDGIPVLGGTPLRNLSVNLGHGHLGWTLAAGSGRAVADLVAGGAPDIDLTGCTIGRYL